MRGRAYFGASCKLDKPMVASAVNLADKLSSGSQWIVYKLKDMQIELKGRMPGFIYRHPLLSSPYECLAKQADGIT